MEIIHPPCTFSQGVFHVTGRDKMDKQMKILQHYEIYPQGFDPITNRLTKIKANGRQYALKRSKLDQRTVKQWENVYHTASQNNLHEIVPVYLTREKQLYVEEDGEYYYLIPWIETSPINRNENYITSTYQQLGKIHVQTKNMYDLNKEKLDDNFNAYKVSCQERQRQLFQWIQQIEQIHYPSPFQLQLLTYYRDLRISLERSQMLVDRIISLADSESIWGVSLNHGALEREHVFEHYIINWEKADYRHAVFDLKELLQKEAMKFPQLQQGYIQSFPVYLEENPLNELERCLLCLYLLNIDDYLSYIEDNLTSRGQHSQIDVSMELERRNRTLIFGLRFESQIDMISNKEESD